MHIPKFTHTTIDKMAVKSQFWSDDINTGSQGVKTPTQTSKNMKGKLQSHYTCQKQCGNNKGDTQWWIQDLQLTERDRATLSQGEDLNDAIIHAAQRVIKEQCEDNLCGFQNPLLGQTLQMKEQNQSQTSVQILHTGMCLLVQYLK